jgi:hypothetical protein
LAWLGLFVAPYLVWKRLYFGTLVPNTFTAKHVPLSAHWLWDFGWPALRDTLASDFGLGALLLLAAFGALGRRDLTARLLAVLGAAYFAYAVWVGYDTLPGHRFFLPALASALLLAVEGGRRAALAPRRRLTVSGAALACAVTVVVAARADRDLRRLMLGITGRLYTVHRELVRQIQARGARAVALRDVGLVGYFCPDVRIVDLAGLTDRTVAHLPGSMDAKLIPLSYLVERDVDVLVAHAGAPPRSEGAQVRLTTADLSPTMAHLLAAPDFTARFRLVRRLPFSPEHQLYLFVRTGGAPRPPPSL